MFKVPSVVLLMIAALITGVVEVVGLHRAALLWNARAAEAPCPASPAAEAADALERPVAKAEPEPSQPEERAHQIGWLAMTGSALEIDLDGRRMHLPGYPAPRSNDHEWPRLTTVVFTPDGEQVAIAGSCFGLSGAADPVVPSCVPRFVRLYRIEDGAHVRDLRTPWHVGTEDARQVLAMRFDRRGERLAVLMESAWSDCSWSGLDVELIVYRLADGARLLRRELGTPGADEVREMRFEDDQVRLRLAAPHGRSKLHIVKLRKQKAT
jgi:hypothetical protein